MNDSFPFGGPIDSKDPPRLSRQLKFVRLILQRGEWYSARELQTELLKYGIDADTASITARIRDLRKPEFGGHEISQKRIDGVARYHLEPPAQKELRRPAW